MGTNDVLSAIESHLKNLASHVRLIIAGTGMDSYTADLSSGTDVLKYRMQPWDQQHFWQAVLKKKNKGGKLVAAILESPILSKLITNARCAMFTSEAVYNFGFRYDSRSLKGSIPSIVRFVLARYVSINGISSLDDAQEKMLAYAVFHELDYSNRSKKPHYVKLEKL